MAMFRVIHQLCAGFDRHLQALLRMNYVGSEALLDDVQLAVLDAHLQKHLHLTAESVARWVKEIGRASCRERV